MNNIFSIDTHVGFSSLMPDLTINLAGLMTEAVESSMMHTFTTPDLFEYYTGNGLAWVITNWHVRINRFPRTNEYIKISTWPVKFRGFLAERGFEITDEHGKSLLNANSKWILLDRVNLKPIRASQDIVDCYGPMSSAKIDTDFTIPTADGFEPLARQDYIVQRRDMDVFGHANNVRYIEWAMEDVPEDVYYGKYKPYELKAVYKKENVTGDAVQLAPAILRTGDEIEILTEISRDGALSARVYTKWREV